MNRKKIALLLTGLAVTSSIFTGCTSSSNNNNKTSSNRARVAQEEPIIRRASERIVKEYNEGQMEQYPNVAYADDIIDNSIGNEMNLNDGNLFNGTIQDYEMNPSDEIITNDQIHNFENSAMQTPIDGFSNVVDEDYNENNVNQNGTSQSNDNSSTSQGRQSVQAPELYVTPKNATETQAGRINVIKSMGTSEITGDKPQGVAEVSFKLSGDVLNITDATTTKTIGALLQSAYEETISDANTGYAGAGTTTEREKLRAALAVIFAPSDNEIKMVFKSSDGVVKTIPFKAAEMFPEATKSANYVRHIVDLDATNRQSKSTRNVDPANMAIKMMIRVDAPDGNKELKTNTEYSFVGTDGNKNLKVTPIDTTKEELTGFSVPNFKTGKIPSKIEAKDDKASVIYEAGDNNTTEGTPKTGNFYLNQGTEKTYISMKKLLTPTGDAAVVEPTGTGVKFKSIILNDTDKTISKIEIEDDRKNKYPVSMVAVDSSKPDLGSYLQVTGLRRDSSYIFTKLHVTYRVGNGDETKTVPFANFDTKLEINNLPITTKAFAAPRLELGAAHDKKVTLPNGLEVPAVKNDSTALRYIVKVDNPEGFVGDIKVNGLRSGEESKVEKIVDETAKVNYYVVTLFNLAPNTDYGFAILEVDYKDPEGKQLIGSQTIGDINNSGADKTDNKTETSALTGTEAFNVIVKEKINSKNARSTEVPIFIDDIQGRFLRVDFTAPDSNPDAKLVYEDGKLKFTDLKPESNTVFKVDMVYRGVDDKEEKNPKYITISTPKVSDLDIKSSKIKSGGTDAEVTFELYSEPKSPIKSVVVKDAQEKEVKSTWDKERKILKLEGLTEKTEYKNLKVTFTLENGKTVDYILESFTTQTEIAKPTGKVAEFVARVYKIALGREPEVEGWEFWIKKLENKEITATELIAENLMTQSEFVDRELSKKNFVSTMYSLIVNRDADEEGQAYWERKYDEYRKVTSSIEELRIKIAREMMDQPEFKELVSELKLKY